MDGQGQTCGRCGATETAVEIAFHKLKSALYPLEIDVRLEKETLSTSTFSKAPLESNRIWISQQSIEEWLSASSGKSQCSGACGDSECRTLTVNEKTYEAIPAELIIKAGLLAASQLFEAPEPDTCRQSAQSPASGAECCSPLVQLLER